MVTRKQVPENASADTSHPGVRPQLWSAADSEPDAEGIWGDQDSVSASASHHATGEAGGSGALQHVPDALRPGVGSKSISYVEDEENPWGDGPNTQSNLPAVNKQEVKLDEVPIALRPAANHPETNPFKRKPLQTTPSVQDATHPPATASEPPPHPPTHAFSQLQVHEPEQSTNPWQPALDDKRPPATIYQAPPLSHQDTGSNVWDSGAPSRQPSTGPASDSPAMPPLQSAEDSQPWDDTPSQPSLPALPQPTIESDAFMDDQHAWDDLGSGNKGKQPISHPQLQRPAGDGWNLIDHEPMPEPAPDTLSRQSTWENFEDAEENKAEEATDAGPAEEPPALPPRNSVDVPPPQPPRHHSPSTANKSETYQIKNINWVDSTVAKNPRKSPILVQNANGPCPLLALVNALTLSTPADHTTSNLVEALRSREQISLEFLLEAVVDELMSSRHLDLDVSLPDMSELYAFLKGLHTGMNVNPRFVPTSEVATAHKRSSLTHVHPSERGDAVPGTFENTRDMELYATFSVPLIHGWLPWREDPVYDALSRQASSYDDAQSLLFREDELEDKLSNSDTGLTEQEQQLYQDVITIKLFLSTSATQLTPWGLEVITRSVKPGSVSILFRNDHFSTLYRHPQTHQLFTLVTDAGYFTHDEVVWESLVDVRGERAEFFSGDFRVVSGPQNHKRSNSVPDAWYDEAESSNNASNCGWQTVQSRRSRNSHQIEAHPGTPISPGHEQEDRDLALALHLQEQEDERQRAEQVARRRESQLSEQYIEQQGRQGNRTGPRNRGGSISRGGASPSIPARGASQLGGGRPPAQQVRSLIPPVSTTHRPADEATEEAPPSYEQASKATPYVPPTGHPSHPSSSPSSATPRRLSSFVGPSNAGPSTPIRGRPGAPPPVAGSNGGAQASGGKDKDCIVM
ncbi:Uu.00g069240.m01.CDS01 [Anthostomella pinea]|uniref:Uu.00g069240.m01.CDS01 n=1 Tax=Anthostomella pinea TaxID=933095 RepID=A0AAI8YNF3_9PEZI|nr:Uu.00g069240.m01.CDS01 [Anthostomella pinea]